MTAYHIKLVEKTTRKGCVDFHVDAPSPEAAAAVVSDAYQTARSKNSDVLTLPDEQTSIIEATDTIDRAVEFVLLDGEGSDREKVVPLDPRSRIH